MLERKKLSSSWNVFKTRGYIKRNKCTFTLVYYIMYFYFLNLLTQQIFLLEKLVDKVKDLRKRPFLSFSSPFVTLFAKWIGLAFFFSIPSFFSCSTWWSDFFRKILLANLTIIKMKSRLKQAKELICVQ